MIRELTVRRYRPADRDRVFELHETAMRDVGAYVEGAPEPDLEDVEDAYLERGGEFLVGTVDEEIVAMGAVRPPTWYITELVDCRAGTGELKRMRVDPAHQRRGYGQAILDALLERARDLGYTELVLDTTPGQTGARDFFEANGFRQIGREQIEGPDEPIDLLVYRRQIEEG